MVAIDEDLLLQLRVQNFLFREAELLDHRQNREWLALIADDIQYKVPARETLYNATLEEEFSRTDLGMYYMDETKETLTARVAKLETNMAWAEYPPSRTRRLVTNVQVKQSSADGIEVHSNFYIYKSRLEKSEDLYIGERRDLLRPVGDSFELVRRLVYLDQTVLLVKNISIFL